MNGAKVLEPIAITEAMLTTSIPETDHPEYAAGTTYAVGDTVQIVATHKVYRSEVAGNVGHNPPDNPYDDTVDPATGYWTELGATNPWAMFDGKSRAVSSAANSIEVNLVPGQTITALGLVNVSAIAVVVNVVDPVAGLVYSRDIDMIDLGDVVDFFTWFFNPPRRKDTFALTDLPYSPDATITIIATAPGETVAIGELIIGRASQIGTMINDAEFSLEDYSIKEKDDAGVASLTAGIFSDTFSMPVAIESARVAAIRRMLARYHATPLLFIGDVNYYETIIYGWYTRLSVVVPGNVFSECNLDIEELS